MDVCIDDNDTKLYDKRARNDDRLFLLYFTMGVYFGPDIKGEPKSALQRFAEDLPPYSSEQLGGSRLKISQVEEIYRSLLSKADQSLVVDSSIFLQFIQGGMGDTVMMPYPQFPGLFPSELHPLSESLNGNKLIENIVHIQAPETSALNPEDVERFRKLTTSQCSPCNKFPILNEGRSNNDQQNQSTPAVKNVSLRCYKRKPRINRIHDEEVPQQDDIIRKRSTTCGDSGVPPPPEVHNIAGLRKRASSEEGEEANDDGPAMLILPTPPRKEVLNEMVAMSNHAYALTGSAVKGQVGPVIGLMDIGESVDSYIFRVALPGVNRDNGAFRCEVESCGKVVIKGETVTGEKKVTRYTQVFEMQTQNLCPPGPFSISFQLPGSVDHRKFRGSFSTNGILEGVVMKDGAESAPVLVDE